MSMTSLFGRRNPLRRELGECRSSLFRLAYMWCHDRALADDLTQGALEKAVCSIDALRDPARLRPWLFGILVNCWRDHLRSRRPCEDIDTLEEHWLAGEDSAEDAASRAELAARVRAAIAALPLGQREVLSLVDLEECTYAEAAQILSIPVGTVMSRLCRGRTALRELLSETPSRREHLRSVK